MRPLEEVCSFKNGLWKGKKGPFIEAGVIRNTNFTKDGRLDDSDIAYLNVEKKQFETRRLEYGDLILEKSGGGPKQPVGRVILFNKQDGDFSFSNFTSVIRIKQRDSLDFKFLHWYLHFLYLSGATETMQKHSTNIRNLQLKEYRQIKVPLPEPEKQKRIVGILDEAFAGIETAIANTEKNLANARELFESNLSQAIDRQFSDAECSNLDQFVKFIDYRGRTPKKVESGLRLITAKNVRMGYLQREPEEFVDPESYESWMTRGIPKEGDVLFTTEAPLGYACQLDTDSKVVFAQRIITLQPVRSVINPAYLKYALMSSPMQTRIHEKATGATASGIKASLLRKIRIPIPSLAEQNKVVKFLEGFEKQCNNLEEIQLAKLASLKELKQSLLQKAFSGELTADRTEQEVESATV